MMQDTEDDLPWQCGDAKTSNERVFTLPRAGIRLCVTQSVIDRQTMFATGDGGVVWEAATATLEYLDAEYGNGALAGWRVLELGAGTGICGLACAALGASHVTLTDLQGALPLLRDNVQTSEHSEAVDVKALTWGETEIADDGARFDMVVCCDCLYQPSHYAALAATISRLNAPLTLISWQPRGKNEEAFLEQARGVGFEVEGQSRSQIEGAASWDWSRARRYRQARDTSSCCPAGSTSLTFTTGRVCGPQGSEAIQKNDHPSSKGAKKPAAR